MAVASSLMLWKVSRLTACPGDDPEEDLNHVELAAARGMVWVDAGVCMITHIKEEGPVVAPSTPLYHRLRRRREAGRLQLSCADTLFLVPHQTLADQRGKLNFDDL